MKMKGFISLIVFATVGVCAANAQMVLNEGEYQATLTAFPSVNAPNGAEEVIAEAFNFSDLMQSAQKEQGSNGEIAEAFKLSDLMQGAEETQDLQGVNYLEMSAQANGEKGAVFAASEFEKHLQMAGSVGQKDLIVKVASDRLVLQSALTGDNVAEYVIEKTVSVDNLTILTCQNAQTLILQKETEGVYLILPDGIKMRLTQK